jgi:hypothetical protein
VDSKQIDEAMRKKLAVYHKGHRYECIQEYVMFYDHTGKRRLSVVLKSGRCSVRVPAEDVYTEKE